MKIPKRLLAICLLATLSACATQPGKPGTPLPPPNKAVGQKWPPEVRQFVDAMLVVFVDSNPPPSPEAIEKAFGVKAVADGDAASNRPYRMQNNYELQGWALRAPAIQNWSAGYRIMLPKSGRQSYQATFYIDTQRYCINPYDFAVYTGSSFAAAPDGGFENPMPLPSVHYQLAYQWGVFDWSPSGQYMGSRVWLQLSDDRRCIKKFEPNATFQITNNR